MAKHQYIRGGCYWVAFDPTTGSEIQKTRPAIIVSIDSANRALNRVVVIPLTSNLEPIFPSDCIVAIDGVPSKAIGSQIRTVSKLRLGKLIGVLAPGDMEKVEHGVKLHLGL